VKPFYLYAVKDTETEKLVDTLANPKRKFWLRYSAALNALYNHKVCPGRSRCRIPADRLKLITLKVEEVPDEN